MSRADLQLEREKIARLNRVIAKRQARMAHHSITSTYGTIFMLYNMARRKLTEAMREIDIALQETENERK